MLDDSTTDECQTPRVPWNKGKLAGRKPPLKLCARLEALAEARVQSLSAFVIELLDRAAKARIPDLVLLKQDASRMRAQLERLERQLEVLEKKKG
jgi:hypothetical protein